MLDCYNTLDIDCCHVYEHHIAFYTLSIKMHLCGSAVYGNLVMTVVCG